MPLCKKKNKGEAMAPQKVIIPKGMVNPGETTIIEIPVALHKQPVVVARRKSQSPPRSDSPQGSSVYAPCPGAQAYTQATMPEYTPQRGRCPGLAALEQESFSSYRSGITQPACSPVCPPQPMSQQMAQTRSPPLVQRTSQQPMGQTKQTYCPGAQRSPRSSRMGSGLASLNSSSIGGNSTMPSDLDETEEREWKQLTHDLQQFQENRRKVLLQGGHLTSERPPSPCPAARMARGAQSPMTSTPSRGGGPPMSLGPSQSMARGPPPPMQRCPPPPPMQRCPPPPVVMCPGPPRGPPPPMQRYPPPRGTTQSSSMAIETMPPARCAPPPPPPEDSPSSNANNCDLTKCPASPMNFQRNDDLLYDTKPKESSTSCGKNLYRRKVKKYPNARK